MPEKWYSILEYKYNNYNLIQARASVPADSPWFSGHFPENPIVPGVAELSIILDLLKKDDPAIGDAIYLKSIKKARFKKIVKPDEIMDITISRDKDKAETYLYRISCDNKTACSGIITVSC